MSTGHPAPDTAPPGERPQPRRPARGAQPGRAARPARPGRERLDVLLLERGLAPSRERARALIMAREVRVNGRMVDKAGTLISRDATCELAGPAVELRYASRGGLKLERALDAFALDPSGCVCLDVGASTGGFTDLLLRRGARRVYAIDVGHGQLAWSLQTDPRVVVLDRTNIRHLATLPETADCAVIDVSFISLRLVLPAVARLLRPGGWIVALVKPQFEAGRAEVARGAGVVSDPRVHRRILRDLLTWLAIPLPNRDEFTTEDTENTERQREKNDDSTRPSAAANSSPRSARRERSTIAPSNHESSSSDESLYTSVSSVVKSVLPSGPRLAAKGLVASPITGRDGNHEYLLWLARCGGAEDASPLVALDDAARDAAIDAALHAAFGVNISQETASKHPKTARPGGPS